jgi:hypothetical protein
MLSGISVDADNWIWNEGSGCACSCMTSGYEETFIASVSGRPIVQPAITPVTMLFRPVHLIVRVCNRTGSQGPDFETLLHSMPRACRCRWEARARIFVYAKLQKVPWPSTTSLLVNQQALKTSLLAVFLNKVTISPSSID